MITHGIDYIFTLRLGRIGYQRVIAIEESLSAPLWGQVVTGKSDVSYIATREGNNPS